MKNALAMGVTKDDADDQAGRGENHEQNGEEGGCQGEEEVVDLTTYVCGTLCNNTRFPVKNDFAMCMFVFFC